MFQIPLLLVGPADKTQAFVAEYILEKNLDRNQVIEIDIEEGTKEIHLDQIRYVTAFSNRSTKSPRLFVIKSLETASSIAQNALLKTLEETQTNQNFILCSKKIEYVLPTIQSRTRIVKVASEVHEKNHELATALEQYLKNPEMALSDPLFQVKKTEDAVFIMDQMILFWRDRMVKMPEVAAVSMKKILHLKHLIVIHNVQPQLAIDSILLTVRRLRS